MSAHNYCDPNQPRLTPHQAQRQPDTPYVAHLYRRWRSLVQQCRVARNYGDARDLAILRQQRLDVEEQLDNVGAPASVRSTSGG